MDAHTLILLRHAKSDWSGGEADVDRPLADRGRRQAPQSGDWLAENIDRIDLAVVSPAVRARSTWELVAGRLGVLPETRYDERAYGASADELLAIIRDLPEEARTVVVVGHNPGLEDLVTELTGEWTPMPTSALAVLTVARPWSEIGPYSAELEASGRPPAI